MRQPKRSLPGLIGWASLLGLGGLLGLAGCAGVPSADLRREQADRLAEVHRWRREQIAAGGFELAIFVPSRLQVGERLAIYIEGDGLAWTTPEQPSLDPTPRTPVGLELALAQPIGNAAYLARPCQYLGGTAAWQCGQRYWTGQRFGSEAIAAADSAIELLKRRFAAQRLTLVGYSGGGTIAALVAARRDDVERLVTVAGNLDPRAWTDYHAVAPLDRSLDPADVREALARIPQWHLVGGRDTVVPPRLTEHFLAGFPPGGQPRTLRVFADYDHRCCWVAAWPRWWTETLGTGSR
jgi:dienelactone hydrolase